jgi:hypothetical protein
VSAKQVAIDLLRAADGPLEAKEIAKAIKTKGRFPNQEAARILIYLATPDERRRIAMGANDKPGASDDSPGSPLVGAPTRERRSAHYNGGDVIVLAASGFWLVKLLSPAGNSTPK